MGQPASLVLAVTHTVRDRVDGREPFRGGASGALRRRVVDGRDRVLDLATTHHRVAGPRLHSQESSWG